MRLRPALALIALLAGTAPALAVEGDKPFALMHGERLGEFHYGMPADQAARRIGCKFNRGKETLWEADGRFHQRWEARECGLSLNLAADQKGGLGLVESIRVRPPSELRTARGIGIGSSEAQVRELYRDTLNAEESQPGRLWVAGSLYGGLVIRLKEGKVAEIFLGAAAE